MAAKHLTYQQAMDELDTIVARIESGEVDVDALAAAVNRASFLVNTCRDRLRAADEAVEKALAGLRDTPACDLEASADEE